MYYRINQTAKVPEMGVCKSDKNHQNSKTCYKSINKYIN